MVLRRLRLLFLASCIVAWVCALIVIRVPRVEADTVALRIFGFSVLTGVFVLTQAAWGLTFAYRAVLTVGVMVAYLLLHGMSVPPPEDRWTLPDWIVNTYIVALSAVLFELVAQISTARRKAFMAARGVRERRRLAAGRAAGEGALLLGLSRFRQAILVMCILVWVAAFTATHTPSKRLPSVQANDFVLHMLGFGALTSAFTLAQAAYGIRHWQRVLLTLSIMVAYAAMDESTQVYVNRVPEVADWLADVCGAGLATVLWEVPLVISTPRVSPKLW